MGLAPADLYWLVGLLEGEGCFLFSRSKAIIQLKMADRDIVERAASLLGTGIRRDERPNQKNPKHSVMFVAILASAAGWMMTLYPLLGIRRQEKIRQVLRAWRGSPVAPKYRSLCAQGHPYTFRLKNGWRRCRKCETKWQRESIARRLSRQIETGEWV